ncbi:MAG TPA: hypothetical protein VGJ95_13330 [Pseudonocardiaceae bacterium]
MRPLVLYLRSRAAPATAATVLGCAVALWALGLAIDHPQGRVLTALLTALAATIALAPGLAGADPDLDRASAIAWPPRRAAHIVVAGAVVAALLAATALAGQQMAGTGHIARNVAGLAGLVALGAAVLGAARAPLLPVIWTVLVLRYAPPMGEPPTRPAYKIMLTWMVQPPDVRSATVTAVALAVAGTLAYAVLGSRRS